jgi:hypothetical protein
MENSNLLYIHPYGGYQSEELLYPLFYNYYEFEENVMLLDYPLIPDIFGDDDTIYDIDESYMISKYFDDSFKF